MWSSSQISSVDVFGLAFALAIPATLACGSTPGDAASDAGGVDAADRDSGTEPIVDPSLFDCSSAGASDSTMLPERASGIPISCALDPTCRTVQISGHRGVGGDLGAIAPEDTLSAYRAGIVMGLEYVETDPRPTSDGVIVNIHDTTVDRTTDGTGTVDEMTFDEVRALNIRTLLRGDYGCERIPTLEEILRTCRGRVVVLIDANKTDRVDLLVAAIHAADAVDWAIFDTSSIDKIDSALAIDPDLHFMIRPRALDEIEPQLDHFAPRLPVIVELGLRTIPLGAPMVHSRGTRVMADVFLADALAIVADDFSGYAEALDDGADILQTDRPDFVMEYLRERGDR